MREIKFRGKCIPDFPHPVAKWVYGSFVSDELILSPYKERNENRHFWYMVDPATVGQYTGLKDADGHDIYEGDILEVDYPFYWAAPPLPRKRVVVCYLNGKFQFHLTSPHSYTDLCFAKLAKVIGNIHDNPNLLEVEHD